MRADEYTRRGEGIDALTGETIVEGRIIGHFDVEGLDARARAMIGRALEVSRLPGREAVAISASGDEEAEIETIGIEIVERDGQCSYVDFETPEAERDYGGATAKRAAGSMAIVAKRHDGETERAMTDMALLGCGEESVRSARVRITVDAAIEEQRLAGWLHAAFIDDEQTRMRAHGGEEIELDHTLWASVKAARTLAETPCAGELRALEKIVEHWCAGAIRVKKARYIVEIGPGPEGTGRKCAAQVAERRK